MNIAHLDHLQDKEAHHQMSALHFEHLEARAERLNDPKAAKRFATIARGHRVAAESLAREIAKQKAVETVIEAHEARALANALTDHLSGAR